MIGYEKDTIVYKQGWGEVYQYTVSQRFLFLIYNCKEFGFFYHLQYSNIIKRFRESREIVVLLRGSPITNNECLFPQKNNMLNVVCCCIYKHKAPSTKYHYLLLWLHSFLYCSLYKSQGYNHLA